MTGVEAKARVWARVKARVRVMALPWVGVRARARARARARILDRGFRVGRVSSSFRAAPYASAGRKRHASVRNGLSRLRAFRRHI